MKKVKNPLSKLLTSENVKQLQNMFGNETAKAIMTKDVYKYVNTNDKPYDERKFKK